MRGEFTRDNHVVPIEGRFFVNAGLVEGEKGRHIKENTIFIHEMFIDIFSLIANHFMFVLVRTVQ
jgi:hypothetical protein